MPWSTGDPNDIVAVAAARTAGGKFGGALKSLPVYDIGAAAIRETLHRIHLKPSHVDDCILGCCRHTGHGTNPARTAARLAGLPETIPAITITMACASGMRAAILGAQAIRSGDAGVAVTGGMESMSTIPYILPDARWEGLRHGHKPLQDGWVDSRDPYLNHQSAGETIEALIVKHKISREEQDEFAHESHLKAAAAQKSGLFADEIIPLETLKHDETIRPDSSLTKLSQLQPAFIEDGSLTAGNSSPFSDGAAILVLSTRQKAEALGLKPLFKIAAYACSGVENEDMGLGPSVTLPMALKKAGLNLKDIDYLEVNEAFAGMILMNERLLKWDRGKLNKKGGAIALGHPVGCSGARILVTLYHVLKDFNGELGAAAIGAAGGVTAALVIHREN